MCVFHTHGHDKCTTETYTRTQKTIWKKSYISCIYEFDEHQKKEITESRDWREKINNNQITTITFLCLATMHLHLKYKMIDDADSDYDDIII